MTPEAVKLAETCIGHLDHALSRPPAELGSEVDVVERELAHIRDLCIDELRTGSTTDRTALDVVNAALSLVVAMEYPAAGIQGGLLEQARDALLSLVGRAAPSGAS